MERSCQVYTAALMSFRSSPFFPDTSFPSGHCICHSDMPPSKDRAPAFLDGWSSATFSLVPGIHALVEAEDIEVSLLGTSVVPENLRGSSEGGLAVQSGHPHFQKPPMSLSFYTCKQRHSGSQIKRHPLHVSGSLLSRHMEELHFLAH